MTVAQRLEKIVYWLTLGLVLWALFSFIVLPLVTALYAALFRDGSFAILDIINELWGSRRVRTAIWNTAWMTAVTTITVTIVGVFQVLVLEYFFVRGRFFLKIGFAVPLIFSSIVATAGYNFTYGQSGILTVAAQRLFPELPSDWFLGWFGVLYAHTFLMTSFYFLFLRAAMRRVDYATIEAARALGAGEMTILRRVVFPVIMPTLMAVTLLTVYGALGSFAAPQVLGGRDFHMLSQMILTLNSLRRQDMAALLALILGIIIHGPHFAFAIFRGEGKLCWRGQRHRFQSNCVDWQIPGQT
ncbi:ABC transporter permease subunit [uncultured Cohaesibacter sp.]|uniref:ABC transporter permease n=1 Tax=uncultured Cohaesibacter sp. TaxID=1002546 RepID=UPI0029300FEC|nr:ABC transporter permease subunit [uncultured Cohaesibacter sp.]